MKKVCVLLISFFISIFFISSQAQELAKNDLSTVKVDNLTDSEIKSFYQQAKSANLNDQQIAELLQARGMPLDEVIKLKERVERLQSSTGTSNSNSVNAGRKVNASESPTYVFVLDSLERQIYGMHLFTSVSSVFQENIRIATPPDYIIGPDDQLILNIYGYQQNKHDLTVSAEGFIDIPNVGPINVNGLSIEAAKSIITKKLASTIYRTINSGLTKVQLTLGDIRTVKVVVIGQAKKPGTYNVSSLSTLFNVLYLAGGPSVDGSFRNIEVIRAGKNVVTMDLYKFLFNGDITNNISLKDNDVIKIPYYEKRIKFTGEVKWPGYFEVVDTENLNDVIKYAGGFSDSAYSSQVRILQVAGKERKIAVLEDKEFTTYYPKKGDEVIVEKILDRFENRVTLTGAVFRPGFYDITPDLTVGQLIKRADGIKEEAYSARATISRLKEDQTREIIALNILEVLNGRSPDVPLQKEDIISVPSILDLRDEMFVKVEGEVRKPGKYFFKQGMTIKDAILEAGGFTDAATGKRLEVGRRIINANDTINSLQIAEVINVDSDKDLNASGKSLELQPHDIVVVRNNPGYYVQKSIIIQGEVKYSGRYVIAEKNERVSDVILRAGGFTDLADARAASLKRVNKLDIDTISKKYALTKLGFRDSTDSARNMLLAPADLIGINLSEILKKPHSSSDIILEDGDVITIPKRDAVVKVRGEVLFPTQLSYIPKQNMVFYINRAGGFSDAAQRRKTFVIGANGNAKRTNSFLFFRNYPRIEAGDEIYIPKKPERTGKGLTTGELVGISSILASLATVVLAFLK